MRMILLLAAALIAAPAIAQDNNAANAVDTNVAAPDANVVDANAMNMDANAVVAMPPVTTEPMPTDTAATTPVPEEKSFPWGLIGLVGLVGLLGRKRS